MNRSEAIKRRSCSTPISAIVYPSRNGNLCWNAPIESFFGKPKGKCVLRVDYRDHDEASMKRILTIFLQISIVLVGIGALAFLLWEPRIEGVNKNAGLVEIYFNFFIAYVYLSSIPFFASLYQAFKVVGYVRHDKIVSQAAVKALRTIKYCAMIVIGLVAISLSFMIFGDPEDRPAGLFMRFLFTFPTIIAAVTAAQFERILRTAVERQSVNDRKV